MRITATALGMLIAATSFAQAPASAPSTTTAEEWFQQHDANKDKFLTKTEVAKTRTEENFDKYDSNKDGKLDYAEYKAGRDAVEGTGASSSAAAPAEGGMGGGEGGMGGGMGGGEAPPAN